MTKSRVFKLTAAAILLLGITAVAGVVISEFLLFQPGVRSIIAALPDDERQLPPNVRSVFSRMGERELNLWVARNLLQDCSQRTGMARWNLRFTLWVLLVPRFYSRTDRISLFAHYLQVEDAQGLRQVSQTAFAKPPHLLSPEEVLGLLAVTKAPNRNSPVKHPERYREELERLKRKYGAV